MATKTVTVRYGGDVGKVTMDLAQASAPILLDGEDIGRQTADARHETARAVELAARHGWGSDVDMDDVEWEEA